MKRVTLLAAVLATLALAALSLAATGHRMHATLTTRAAVPKAIGTSRATGAFSGSYVVHAKDVKLVWKLSFARLTGRATGATLRIGKPGVVGTTVTVLCKPCKSGAVATTLVRKFVAAPLQAGRTYVTVYTKRNPAGEIRGQIRVKG